ncbi:MAG: TadE/TadG family type IV pilus assembly protein [Pirellulales bacterium]
MLTLELVLTLPLLLLLLLATVVFALLLMVSQAIHAAAGAGAREAALPDATAASVQDVVDQALHHWRFADRVRPVVIEPADPQTAHTGDPVSVRVSVGWTAAVPDLLKWIGLSFEGRQICAEYVARKE